MVNREEEIKNIFKALSTELKQLTEPFVSQYEQEYSIVRKYFEASAEGLSERDRYIKSSGFSYDSFSIYEKCKKLAKPAIEDLRSKYVGILNFFIEDWNKDINDFILGDFGRLVCEKWGWKYGGKRHLKISEVLCIDSDVVERFGLVDIQMNGLGFSYYVQGWRLQDFLRSKEFVLKKYSRGPIYSVKKYSNDFLMVDLCKLKYIEVDGSETNELINKLRLFKKDKI